MTDIYLDDVVADLRAAEVDPTLPAALRQASGLCADALETRQPRELFLRLRSIRDNASASTESRIAATLSATLVASLYAPPRIPPEE